MDAGCPFTETVIGAPESASACTENDFSIAIWRQRPVSSDTVSAISMTCGELEDAPLRTPASAVSEVQGVGSIIEPVIVCIPFLYESRKDTLGTVGVELST